MQLEEKPKEGWIKRKPAMFVLSVQRSGVAFDDSVEFEISATDACCIFQGSHGVSALSFCLLHIISN